MHTTTKLEQYDYPECNYKNQTKWWQSQCAGLRIYSLPLASNEHWHIFV